MSEVIKCVHCGEPILDNGTVYVHIRVVNGGTLQTQWCDDSKRYLADAELTDAPSPAREETPNNQRSSAAGIKAVGQLLKTRFAGTGYYPATVNFEDCDKLMQAAFDAGARSEAASALVTAVETCHICTCLVLLDDGPTRCEDCSSDCDDHDEPECKPIYVLHEALKKLIAGALFVVVDPQKEK